MQQLWMLSLLFGVPALLVRVGQGMYESGLSRSKNAASGLMRHVCDLCISTLVFWAVGAALLMPARGAVIGFDARLLVASPMDGAETLFLYLVMVLIGTGVFSGVIAERARFLPSCLASVVLAGLVIPIAGHWAWRGWLHHLGFIDVAGASVLHVAVATFAAVGSVFIGPRMGKYNKDGSSNAIPGHNLPLVSIGVLIMLAGWLPYVLGASAVAGKLGAQTGMNVILSGAAGGLVALIYGRLRYGKPEAFLTCSGLIGGLVAITAGAGTVGSIGAVLIGAIAGLIVPLLAVLIDLVWRIDDPTAALSIHGVAGIWGTLAAGLLGAGDLGARLRLLGVQALGLLAIISLAAIVGAGLFAVLRATVGLRSREADEFDGLDLAEHDVNAYPDFQQTMIKSYHLREA